MSGPHKGSPPSSSSAAMHGMATINGRPYVNRSRKSSSNNQPAPTLVSGIHNSKETRGFGGEIRCMDGLVPMTELAAREFMADVYAPPLVVGFGAIWKPTSQTEAGSNPCAVLQIATTKRVWLFRICRFPEDQPPLPDCIRYVLDDPQIVKVVVSFGVVEKSMFSGAFGGCRLPDSSWIDVDVLLRNAGFERLPLEKLAAQCGIILAAHDFPETVWDDVSLSEMVVRYCADRAWVPLLLVEQLISQFFVSPNNLIGAGADWQQRMPYLRKAWDLLLPCNAHPLLTNVRPAVTSQGADIYLENYLPMVSGATGSGDGSIVSRAVAAAAIRTETGPAPTVTNLAELEIASTPSTTKMFIIPEDSSFPVDTQSSVSRDSEEVLLEEILEYIAPTSWTSLDQLPKRLRRPTSFYQKNREVFRCRQLPNSQFEVRVRTEEWVPSVSVLAQDWRGEYETVLTNWVQAEVYAKWHQKQARTTLSDLEDELELIRSRLQLEGIFLLSAKWCWNKSDYFTLAPKGKDWFVAHWIQTLQKLHTMSGKQTRGEENCATNKTEDAKNIILGAQQTKMTKTSYEN